MVTDRISRSLNGFHHRVARRLSGLPIRYDPIAEDWIRPAPPLALERASLLPMSEYLLRRRHYLLNWAQDRPLFRSTRHLQGGAGGSLRKYWWSSYPNAL